ncbi:uncharacterized protein LOC106167524 [Lingula anatina]|uniref:Uncharacterized protein LOC106167524 n=1 Tax=Lingula anatina TaxID=7574 RepID=A0A1S3IUM8_LINAN|nr:uncharacterized protein LOC106167524 [Lingula anatina]|eukprot:XP_013401778.1 uncharacterized protein LOC106167524 [Lingula anatina]
MRLYVIYLYLVVALARPTLSKDQEDYVSKDSSAQHKAGLQGTTLHYYYESEAKLFGPAEEIFHISADVDVEYIGGGFGNYIDGNASSFLMFMHNVFVQVIKGNGTTSQSEAPLSADDLYDQPTWFVQLGNGTIAEARFTKKDLGNINVMNFKRSILSALQTNLVRDKENVIETDVMGTHNSRYSNMVSKCSTNWEICKEILDLYITAGGKEVEQTLSDLVLSHPLSADQKQELVQKLSFIAKPTKHILTTVKTLWNTLFSQGDPSQSHVILTLGSLASKETTSTGFRSELVDLLRRHLQSGDKNNDTEQISDALEAIGNFGDNRLIPDVLAIANKGKQSEEIEIGCIHALRRNFHVKSVQKWLVDLLTRPTSTCELREAAVVTIKRELAYRKALDTKNKAWPNSGVTDVDAILLNALVMADVKYECALSDIKDYFQLKGVPVGNTFKTYYTTNSTRTKRRVDHRDCSSWSTHGSRYSELLSLWQFSSDNYFYPDNKHCLSHISYGPSKAHVYIKSGVFAGTNKQRGYCKLYGKSIAKLKVFSKSLTLASAEAYRLKVGSSRTRVYLNVYGKTVSGP